MLKPDTIPAVIFHDSDRLQLVYYDPDGKYLRLITADSVALNLDEILQAFQSVANRVHSSNHGICSLLVTRDICEALVEDIPENIGTKRADQLWRERVSHSSSFRGTIWVDKDYVLHFSEVFGPERPPSMNMWVMWAFQELFLQYKDNQPPFSCHDMCSFVKNKETSITIVNTSDYYYLTYKRPDVQTRPPVELLAAEWMDLDCRMSSFSTSGRCLLCWTQCCRSHGLDAFLWHRNSERVFCLNRMRPDILIESMGVRAPFPLFIACMHLPEAGIINRKNFHIPEHPVDPSANLRKFLTKWPNLPEYGYPRE